MYFLPKIKHSELPVYYIEHLQCEDNLDEIFFNYFYSDKVINGC